MEEVLAEKDNVEDLNDACELLMEHSACSRVRDQTVDTQANYTKLLTAAQGKQVLCADFDHNNRNNIFL